MKKEAIEAEFGAWVGIDWADEKHAVCLRPEGSEEIEYFELKQEPEAIVDWIHGLRSRFGGRKIAIALEQSRGALIYMLMNFDFLTFFPINPKTMKMYREALRSSGAKDDPSDAELLLDFLQTHRKHLRVWKPEEPQTRKLRMLVEGRRKLVNNSSSVCLRIEQLLKYYYPQALNWVGDLKSPLACDFLMKWPSLETVKKAKPVQLRKFYWKHNCRNNELIEQRISEVSRAIPLTEDEAIVSSSVLMLQALIPVIRELTAAIERFERQIQECFQEYPDRFLYESLPGAGAALQPRLAVAMGMDRDRFQSSVELQQFSGIAPVTVKSGKNSWVHWRWACPKFVRQSFHEFAGCSLVKSSWAKAYYDQMRAKNKGHHAALRAVAFKWQRIIFRCWKDGKPYDENQYLKVLQRRGSPFMSLVHLTKPASLSQSSWKGAGSIIAQLVQSSSGKQCGKIENAKTQSRKTT